MIALEGRGLQRRFGGFYALKGVDLAVEQGEIRGLIGPNGAGKSTLIDVISGRAPQIGRVWMNGVEISRLTVQKRRRVGMARSFQRTSIFPELSVGEQLRLAESRVETKNLAEVMAELGLEHLKGSKAADISYGDQRRLDLAIALMGRPTILLLDEPAAGLSMQESLTLASLLKDLAQRWKVTVLLVEHDMEVVFSICTKISVLHLGAVLFEGSPAEVRANAQVVEAYLGSAA